MFKSTDHESTGHQATNHKAGRRIRLLMGAVAATGGLAGAGVAVSAGTAGAEPNICTVAADNAAYYQAEYDVMLPGGGYQPTLTEVHIGLTYVHQAQMWKSIGRGFGC